MGILLIHSYPPKDLRISASRNSMERPAVTAPNSDLLIRHCALTDTTKFSLMIHVSGHMSEGYKLEVTESAFQQIAHLIGFS